MYSFERNPEKGSNTTGVGSDLGCGERYDLECGQMLSNMRGPNESDPRTLGGKIVIEVTQTEYLGATMTVEGITHHNFLDRISKAKKRLYQIKSTGLNNTGFHSPTNRRTYTTLVRSMTEYQIHFTPWTNTLAIAYQSLENEIFNAAGGFKERKAQRWRKAFKLQPVSCRRARLRGNLSSWLSRERRPELGNLQYALTRPRNLDVCPDLETLFNRADEGKVRPLPLPLGNLLIPFLYCSKNKHRALGLQWYVQ